MPNRLANETSPYLLQHQHNPVDWFAWGDEAFSEARRLDKPILLSVGYSACHWCHVMAHESFENPDIAAQMNQGFVNIKVDREERPDVDAIYMQAVQALTGRGGWPMTVFLTPEAVPFYGGTYFPPEDRQGMPGFPRVLAAVTDAYRNKRADLDRTGQQLMAQMESMARLQSEDTDVTPAQLDDAFEAISASFDEEFAGFGRAPKFPPAMTLDFLMRYYKRTGNARSLEMVEKTLVAMAFGGMYDQAGGGFHRYSTDAVWLVPHFEKMLYDNALLARAYLDAFRLTGKPLYERIATEVIDYVLREMTDASGAFYSTQDADSEGEEGKFFLWTPAELKAALGEDADLMGRFYDVTEAGNFEGSNILHIQRAPEYFAEQNGMTPEAFATLLESARRRLYAAREARIHPARDEKVLSAWNGLMLRAIAEAAFVFDSATYRDAAINNADFLLREMRPNGRLLRTWKDGTARLNGYLEDYACLIDALLAVYQLNFELRYLAAATELADEMIALFWDDSVNGFFDTGKDHETLISRPRDLFDNATPSGASVATDVLLRIALLTGNDDYETRAIAGLKALAPFLERAASSFGRMLSALDFHLSRPQELALVWREDATSVDAFIEPLRLRYEPHLLLVGGREGSGAEVTPLLADRTAIGGKTTAYLCERFVCQAPTTDPAELLRQLANL